MKLPEKIAIYGAGFLGKWMFYHLKILGIKVEFFIDEYKKEKIFCGCKVYRIKEISKKDIPICICISRDSEKVKDLLKQKGFSHVYILEEFVKNIKKIKDLKKYVENFKTDTFFLCEEIILDSALGGGSNLYVDSYLGKSCKSIVLIRAFPVNFFEVSFLLCVYNNKESIFSGANILYKILMNSNFKNLIINHIITYPIPELIEMLKKVKKNKKIRVIFNLHDYFTVCPSFNLLNQDAEFCNIPEDIKFCEKCLKANPFVKQMITYNFLKVDSLVQWRKIFKDFFEIVDEVRCFSNTSKELILKAYPFLEEKIKVIPHKVDWVRPVKINTDFRNLNIGILGNINIPKGARVVWNLYRYLKEKKLKNVKLHVFGRLTIDKPVEEDDLLKIHGFYRKEELSELMEQHNINIIFIPSICPETFCYTAEEGMKMGLPVAVFNIGALAERVKTYEKGIILDYKKKEKPAYVLETILKFWRKLNYERK